MNFLRRKSPKATEALLPGQISYLKKRADCNEEDLSRVDLSDGCFDHLVLILSTDPRTAQTEALIVSLSQIPKSGFSMSEGLITDFSLHLSGERPSKRDIHTIAASDSSIYQ